MMRLEEMLIDFIMPVYLEEINQDPSKFFFIVLSGEVSFKEYNLVRLNVIENRVTIIYNNKFLLRVPKEKVLVIIFNLNHMRKGRGKESDEDDKAESRMELKNKLNFVSQDFSLSRLTESLSDNHRGVSLFPQINEPTLEFKDTQPSHHLKLEDSSLDRFEPEGLTARLSYQERSNNQLFLMQERVQALMKEVEDKNAEIIAGKKRNDHLQKELDRTKKELQRKNELLDSQEKELSTLKLKQSMSDYESKNLSSNSKSLMEDSLQNFCPELLSPQETVQLLNQLLKKVSRSSKMMKSLTSDVSTKEILAKINKN